jgi:hypothetical protein
LARARGGVLYSDDLALRQFAENEWKLDGCWTGTIIDALQASGALSTEDNARARARLAAANYHFVSVDGETLAWLVREKRMRVDPEVRRVFRLLRGGECDESSAVRVAGDCLASLWRSDVPAAVRPAIVAALLQALTTERQPSRVLDPLVERVHARLARDLDAGRAQDLVEHIRLWRGQQPHSVGTPAGFARRPSGLLVPG